MGLRDLAPWQRVCAQFAFGLVRTFRSRYSAEASTRSVAVERRSCSGTRGRCDPDPAWARMGRLFRFWVKIHNERAANLFRFFVGNGGQLRIGFALPGTSTRRPRGRWTSRSRPPRTRHPDHNERTVGGACTTCAAVPSQRRKTFLSIAGRVCWWATYGVVRDLSPSSSTDNDTDTVIVSGHRSDSNISPHGGLRSSMIIIELRRGICQQLTHTSDTRALIHLQRSLTVTGRP